MPFKNILFFIFCLSIYSCSSNFNAVERITRESFGKAPDGTPVELFTLKNKNGMQVQITNYGGIITTLKVPDGRGETVDVVLGYYTLEKYIEKSPSFGCLVGRYGNRIAKGKFTLDGVEYNLAINNGPNHLHGGKIGFDKRVWEPELIEEENTAGLKLLYFSPHMEEGYPGNLNVVAIYWLNDDNELKLDFKATTDQRTVLNLTHHSYFNLKGHDSGDILDHQVKFFAAQIVAIDSASIPTGTLLDVENTPFDFRELKTIGKDIDAGHQQIKNGNGYDHSFVITGQPGDLRQACIVKEPDSGRILEVWTTEPAVQFYTANFLDGSITGKDETIYEKRSGFCLEAQHFPDSPNHPDFPSTVLDPGATFQQTTIYKFK
ncbi:MAG: galactose mutarotase [Cyclobacteriaceae bacterium]|nr:galactose mutarotase [Cyclobacteriaceae bacterium]